MPQSTSPMPDFMAESYKDSATEIAAMLRCANLPYTGPETLPHGDKTEITRSADGKTIIYADATPAVFYSLSSNGASMQAGTGDDMLELMITILKTIEEGMLTMKGYDTPDY